jgi:effector-binding domain-containing protein
MDPNMKNSYSENPCGLNATNTWNGDKVGQGSQTIEVVIPNTYIKTSLVYGPDPNPQVSEWHFEQTEEGTKVSWNFIGTDVPFMGRPMNYLKSYFISTAYVSGLASLKQVCEAIPVQPKPVYEIKTIELPSVNYLIIREDVSVQDIGRFYATSYGKIGAFMAKNNLAMAGAPSGLCYQWTDSVVSLAAAIAVDGVVSCGEEVQFLPLDATKALLVDYYGNYNAIGDAHHSLEKYVQDHGLQMNGPLREVYLTDPEAEADTAKWLTQILYPIK